MVKIVRGRKEEPAHTRYFHAKGSKRTCSQHILNCHHDTGQPVNLTSMDTESKGNTGKSGIGRGPWAHCRENDHKNLSRERPQASRKRPASYTQGRTEARPRTRKNDEGQRRGKAQRTHEVGKLTPRKDTKRDAQNKGKNDEIRKSPGREASHTTSNGP